MNNYKTNKNQIKLLLNKKNQNQKKQNNLLVNHVVRVLNQKQRIKITWDLNNNEKTMKDLAKKK
eukprot:UN01407